MKAGLLVYCQLSSCRTKLRSLVDEGKNLQQFTRKRYKEGGLVIQTYLYKLDKLVIYHILYNNHIEVQKCTTKTTIAYGSKFTSAWYHVNGYSVGDTNRIKLVTSLYCLLTLAISVGVRAPLMSCLFANMSKDAPDNLCPNIEQVIDHLRYTLCIQPKYVSTLSKKDFCDPNTEWTCTL